MPTWKAAVGPRESCPASCSLCTFPVTYVDRVMLFVYISSKRAAGSTMYSKPPLVGPRRCEGYKSVHGRYTHTSHRKQKQIELSSFFAARRCPKLPPALPQHRHQHDPYTTPQLDFSVHPNSRLPPIPNQCSNHNGYTGCWIAAAPSPPCYLRCSGTSLCMNNTDALEFVLQLILAVHALVCLHVCTLHRWEIVCAAGSDDITALTVHHFFKIFARTLSRYSTFLHTYIFPTTQPSHTSNVDFANGFVPKKEADDKAQPINPNSHRGDFVPQRVGHCLSLPS